VNKNYVEFALHISVTLEELSIRNYLRNLTFKVQIVKKVKYQYMFHSEASSYRSILYADLSDLIALCRRSYIFSCGSNKIASNKMITSL